MMDKYYKNREYSPMKVSVNRSGELGDMIDYLSNRLQLKPAAVLAYCVSRVYDKERVDEAKMKDYLDGGAK